MPPQQTAAPAVVDKAHVCCSPASSVTSLTKRTSLHTAGVPLGVTVGVGEPVGEPVEVVVGVWLPVEVVAGVWLPVEVVGGVWLPVEVVVGVSEGEAPVDNEALGVLCGEAGTGIMRMRLLPVSAIHTSPDAPTATPKGFASAALVAGPSSPLKPATPFPATVLMTPVEADTKRMRLLDLSAIHKSPDAPTATPVGPQSDALVAGPLSPLKPLVPFPATVQMSPEEADTRRMRWLYVSAAHTSPEAPAATPEGLRSTALVAGPLSPLKP